MFEAMKAGARLRGLDPAGVAEIARLRVAAGKEKQMSRRVDLNLTIQRLQTEIGEHQKTIAGKAL